MAKGKRRQFQSTYKYDLQGAVHVKALAFQKAKKAFLLLMYFLTASPAPPPLPPNRVLQIILWGLAKGN